MKIEVEKVGIFICMMKNEIPLCREFSSSGSTKEPVMNFESNTVIEIDLIEFCAYLQ